MEEMVCRKCGQPQGGSGTVCRKCRAERIRSVVYFVVACVLIVGIVEMIGSFIVSLYLGPVLKQIEDENKRPASRFR